MYKVTNKSTVHGKDTPHGKRTPHRWPTQVLTLDEFEIMTESLFPTGRFWWMEKGGVFNSLIRSINSSLVGSVGQGQAFLNSIYPDNSGFDEVDLEILEIKLGINPVGDFEFRKKIVIDRLNYSSRSIGRQGIDYLNHIIDINGYKAKIYENPMGDDGAYMHPNEIMDSMINQNQHSLSIQHGTNIQHGFSNYEIIANEYSNESYSFGGEGNLWATFFIASKHSLFESASVPLNKVEDFKKLILKIKAAHLIGFFFNS